MRLSSIMQETAFSIKQPKIGPAVSFRHDELLFLVCCYWPSGLPFNETGLPVHGLIRQTILNNLSGGETVATNRQIAKNWAGMMIPNNFRLWC